MNKTSNRLAEGFSGRVLVITGSGISSDSGIPTFRGEGGYWRHYKAGELATRAAFERHPDVVWDWYRERRRVIAAARPNVAHDALVAVAQHAQEFLLVTQNVDDLHERAAWDGRQMPTAQIVHIHGEILITRCSQCTHSYRIKLAADAPGVPKCPNCQGLLRPGVVWFDEGLDAIEERRIREFIAKGDCDIVLVVGTTAVFDYIRDWATEARGRDGCLIEINLQETLLSGNADMIIREHAATALPRLVCESASNNDPLET